MIESGVSEGGMFEGSVSAGSVFEGWVFEWGACEKSREEVGPFPAGERAPGLLTGAGRWIGPVWVLLWGGLPASLGSGRGLVCSCSFGSEGSWSGALRAQAEGEQGGVVGSCCCGAVEGDSCRCCCRCCCRKGVAEARGEEGGDSSLC